MWGDQELQECAVRGESVWATADTSASRCKHRRVPARVSSRLPRQDALSPCPVPPCNPHLGEPLAQQAGVLLVLRTQRVCLPRRVGDGRLLRRCQLAAVAPNEALHLDLQALPAQAGGIGSAASLVVDTWDRCVR